MPPTAEERKWLVGGVEGYKCPKCGKDERYPRYNHPGKLLGKLYLHLSCDGRLLKRMGSLIVTGFQHLFGVAVQGRVNHFS